MVKRADDRVRWSEWTVKVTLLTMSASNPFLTALRSRIESQTKESSLNLLLPISGQSLSSSLSSLSLSSLINSPLNSFRTHRSTTIQTSTWPLSKTHQETSYLLPSSCMYLIFDPFIHLSTHFIFFNHSQTKPHEIIQAIKSFIYNSLRRTDDALNVFQQFNRPSHPAKSVSDLQRKPPSRPLLTLWINWSLNPDYVHFISYVLLNQNRHDELVQLYEKATQKITHEYQHVNYLFSATCSSPNHTSRKKLDWLSTSFSSPSFFLLSQVAIDAYLNLAEIGRIKDQQQVVEQHILSPSPTPWSNMAKETWHTSTYSLEGFPPF